MASYVINIVRDSEKGWLTFEHGLISVAFSCWWDPAVVIEAGTYGGYATRMNSKDDGYTKDANGETKREAIWLGTGVPISKQGRKSNEIFIHRGTDAGWSDGCIVGDPDQVFEIWNCIQPKEQKAIDVIVKDRLASYIPYRKGG